ncbi:unnamed protein product [Thlaspi arvense]|uniref:Uncharacterized protein n=1 Tax=Thlaspi arvense TaxID=13288 RepID=A0AAU9SEH4_THLAR|nr:unnamed protein product [Thlaspi arvense]
MLVNLVEIDPLESIPKLQYLSLLDNNITKKPNYLLYVIYKLKSLRVLDFIKVKAKKRRLRRFLRRRFKKFQILHNNQRLQKWWLQHPNFSDQGCNYQLPDALKFGQVPAGLIIPDPVHSNIATKDGSDPMEQWPGVMALREWHT